MILFTGKFADKRFFFTFCLSPFCSYFIISTRNIKCTVLVCEYVFNTSYCFPLWNTKIFSWPNCSIKGITDSTLLLRH